MDLSFYFPIVLSLKVGVLAIAVAAPLGIGLAWMQAVSVYRFKSVVDAVILLPLVLPPSVVGFFLIVLFGVEGVIGSWLLHFFDLRLGFSQIAVVMASATVALPLIVKTAQPALEAVPGELLDVGRTLGLGRVGLFWRVVLPLAWRGVVAATVLGFARGIGEFGATLMFAGNIPGLTNTLPLEIYTAYQRGDDSTALIYVLTMTVLSCAVVLLASQLTSTRESA
jgi:molybdate transport system permease protein